MCRTPPSRMLIPLASWLLGVPGVLALLAGGLLLAADDSVLPPLLAEPGAALVLIVSAVALLGSAAFPLVFSRLAARDSHADEGAEHHNQ